MAQLLGALAALPEDVSSVPSTYGTRRTADRVNLTPTSTRYKCSLHTDMKAKHSHTHYINKSLKINVFSPWRLLSLSQIKYRIALCTNSTNKCLLNTMSGNKFDPIDCVD